MLPTRLYPTYIPNSLRENGTLFRTDRRQDGSSVGVSVRDWKQRIFEERDASSDYVVNRYFVDRSEPFSYRHTTAVRFPSGALTGFVSHRRQGYWIDYTSHDNLGTHLVTVTPEQRAAALSKIHDKIRATEYGVDGLIILGELRETISLLRNPLLAMRKGIKTYVSTLETTSARIRRELRARKSETPAHLLNRRRNAVKDAMAGSWLEFSFGVKPLISDVEDVCETITKTLEGKPRKRRLSSKSPQGTRTSIVTHSQGYVSGWNYERIRYSSSKTTTADVMFVAGMKREIIGPLSAAKWGSRMGLQFQNFLPAAWELLPWSFLIDYFVNIGDIVEASCTDMSQVIYLNEIAKEETTWKCDEHIQAFSDPFTASGNMNVTTEFSGNVASGRTARRLTLTRTAKPPTIPPIIVSTPQGTSLKWVNMAALLAQFKATNLSTDPRFFSRRIPD